jgi:hypothetical protein
MSAVQAASCNGKIRWINQIPDHDIHGLSLSTRERSAEWCRGISPEQPPRSSSSVLSILLLLLVFTCVYLIVRVWRIVLPPSSRRYRSSLKIISWCAQKQERQTSPAFLIVTIRPRRTTTTPCCRHERRPHDDDHDDHAHTRRFRRLASGRPETCLYRISSQNPLCPLALYRRYVTNGSMSRFPYPITSHCMRHTH